MKELIAICISIITIIYISALLIGHENSGYMKCDKKRITRLEKYTGVSIFYQFGCYMGETIQEEE